MPILYGKMRSDAEVQEHVLRYVKSIYATADDRFHVIMSLVPVKPSVILDYGCGWGHYATALRDMGHRVDAIDISQNEIEICRLVWGCQGNPHFRSVGISHFEDERFDCVLSNQVIEHVHNVGNYLTRVNRVLKAGGRLIISLPNVMNPRFLLSSLRSNLEDRLKKHSRHLIENYDKAHDHIHSWDPQHFTTLLASMGFVLERYMPTEGVPFPMRKPFIPYIRSNRGRFGNLSYTMTFAFQKVRTVTVQADE